MRINNISAFVENGPESVSHTQNETISENEVAEESTRWLRKAKPIYQTDETLPPTIFNLMSKNTPTIYVPSYHYSPTFVYMHVLSDN